MVNIAATALIYREYEREMCTLTAINSLLSHSLFAFHTLQCVYVCALCRCRKAKILIYLLWSCQTKQNNQFVICWNRFKKFCHILSCVTTHRPETAGGRATCKKNSSRKPVSVCVCFTVKIKRACHIDSESHYNTSFAIQAIWLFLLWLCARFMTFSIVCVCVCAKNSIIKYQHTHTSTAH